MKPVRYTILTSEPRRPHPRRSDSASFARRAASSGRSPDYQARRAWNPGIGAPSSTRAPRTDASLWNAVRRTYTRSMAASGRPRDFGAGERSKPCRRRRVHPEARGDQAPQAPSRKNFPEVSGRASRAGRRPRREPDAPDAHPGLRAPRRRRRTARPPRRHATHCSASASFPSVL